MSTQIDAVRSAALDAKEHDLSTAAHAHTELLRALFDVTALLQSNSALSSLFDNDSTAGDAREWLKENSVEYGCHFDEASLPSPTISHDATTSFPSDSQSQSGFIVERANGTPDGTLAVDSSATAVSINHSSSGLMTAASAHGSSAVIIGSETKSRAESKSLDMPVTTKRSEESAAPAKLAPPAPEDEANLDNATREHLHLDTGSEKCAKTVHLPSQDVQEAHLRERAEARHAKSSHDNERPSHLHAQADAASSPSSTIGAYSAATPMLPQDSPDTSPDSEPPQLEVPEDLRPSPEEQREKAEHDRNLAAQKEIARQQALGDIATPDEQLRWEEREAAAREAEEQAARDDRGGPEPSTRASARPTEAALVVADMERERRNGTEQSPPATTQRQKGAADSEDDGIAVDPRRATPIREHSAPPRDAADRIPKIETTPAATARVQFNQMETESARRNESTVSSASRRRASSIEPVSPKSTRRNGVVAHLPDVSTPRHSQRLQEQSSPVGEIAALSELASLKGAADDPDRDYLEPLFRIQAHESPAINTVPLPDLIKSATKTLCTEDYFTSTHERIDFRMLRRIYQLQNANKWPLRQMEKCKEPPPPLTHQDHMMAEMRWMGKDFRAERKMKKSVCAWLARRCADYVAADAEERVEMRVKIKNTRTIADMVEDESLPELEVNGESAPEDEGMPHTPTLGATIRTSLVVAPELADHVHRLQKSGSLREALEGVPLWQPELVSRHLKKTMTQVSKFVEGKILPRQQQPSRKRSRYDYEDEAELENAQPRSKRARDEIDMPPEDSEIALFHPDNKHIRDRLHANNVFRPPSEFQMPSTPFYEFRNGSQWVWEDDQKLRKLAKDYSFNWSLISAEMALPSRFKSGMERRTPWECFERWVELETLPAEMRKTVYFKTWFQRLEQSQQAVERRYNAQVAAIQQAQQQSGVNAPQQHLPMRRRTLPTRVEKRKSTRHLWTVDAMRKLAKKREMADYKKAESARAAAQRKSSQQAETNQQPRAPMMTPQEFSKKRYERDLQMAEMQRQHRQKLMEQQQRSQQIARAAQQGAGGAPNAPRPGTAGQQQVPAPGQQQQVMNGQAAQQARQAVQAPIRNGHLAVPQVNAQGIPQAHVRPGMPSAQPADMQRMAQATAQARQGQYAGQQFPVPNASMISPVANSGSMTTRQQIESNQALLAAFQAQNQGSQQHSQLSASVLRDSHGQVVQVNGQQHMSPNMPPPPTPQGNLQQLSSGHVPAVIAIKNQLRARYPNMTEAELTNFATEQLKHQSQSSTQVRQNAMNAAAGLSNAAIPTVSTNMQVYAQNQQGYPTNGVNGYATPDASSANNSSQSPQHSYAQMMRQRQMQQMRMQQSPNTPHAQLANGSPNMANASLNGVPGSPAGLYQGVNNVPNMTARPPSRVGSSGGLGSPGLQGSPRGVGASMAR